jgi:hypothetical protein
MLLTAPLAVTLAFLVSAVITYGCLALQALTRRP